MGSDFERRDSRKRRRLSERRRVFSRMGVSNSAGDSSGNLGNTGDQQQQAFEDHYLSRSDSPLGARDSGKISMKIQFHIIVAPDSEPLIVDTSSLFAAAAAATSATPTLSGPSRTKSTDSSIGDQIQERLNRQSSSTKRRQQLLAMHNATHSALDSGKNSQKLGTANQQQLADNIHSEDNLAASRFRSNEPEIAGREHGARSSTLTDGMSDEATLRFLARHHQLERPLAQQQPASSSNSGSLQVGGGARQQNHHHSQQQQQRQHIYFKRDGQRFGHEFTLKLAVDKTYRCLLKVRPLIPIQAISIQGHHVLFADCSNATPATSSATLGASNGLNSAPISSANLSRSWQSIQHKRETGINHRNSASMATGSNANNGTSTNNHRLNHAQSSVTPLTSASNSSALSSSPLRRSEQSVLIRQQQQSQMMRHFAASHCNLSSSSHLGSQLIYMFDWPASRFEVNKNKNRTQVHTVLKFKNGQILSLPLQVKFYQPECRQHLEWGSQLHFIDYDCTINDMGLINVDRIQYY